MMHFFRIPLLTLVLLSSSSCAQDKSTENVEWSNKVTGSWPNKGVAKIVAHRFTLPERSQGFSMMSDSRVNLTALKKLSVKSAELTAKQRTTFLSAALSKEVGLSPAACYDPHHIFLLYDKKGQLINAFEVCFSCTNVRALPDFKEEHWRHHDWKALAFLCDEIGIGLGADTAEQFVKLHEGRLNAKE